MLEGARDPLVERLLVYAPVESDGAAPLRALGHEGMWTATCETLEQLSAEIDAGAAMVVVTEGALSAEVIARLAVAVAAQPTWSDLPVVVRATSGDGCAEGPLRARALEQLGNVVFVDGPVATNALVATVRASLRGRRRQLDLRDVVADLERAAEERTQLLESERVARSEAEEANRGKDEFLSMISHELRTPLNAILGWSRLMSGGRLVEAQRERAVQTIERNAVAQAKLIDELLDVSRILSRKLKLSLRPVDLRSIVEASVESQRASAEAKGLTLALVRAPLPTLVMGDPSRLRQIVSKLLENAIKFTPAGGLIEVALSSREGGAARLVLRDDGVGIDEDFLAYVFDRFRQADGSHTRTHGGLGLGLSIVRSLVELHSGEVTAASDGLGRGAEFVVTLPLVSDAELSAPRGSDRPPPSQSDVLKGMRVVVVDDEQDARELVTAVLEQAGAVVTSVATAEEAMRVIDEHPPGLLVSHIFLPGQDGYALIARVRALPAERGGTIPALAVAAFARADDRDLPLRAGFTAHVEKPIDPWELVTVAANIATRSRPATALRSPT
jgi:signal transduction histidine kinase